MSAVTNTRSHLEEDWEQVSPELQLRKAVPLPLKMSGIIGWCRGTQAVLPFTPLIAHLSQAAIICHQREGLPRD